MAKFTYTEDRFVDGKLIPAGTVVDSPTQPANTISAGEAASRPKAVVTAAGESGDFCRSSKLAGTQYGPDRTVHDKTGASHDPSRGSAWAVRPRWSAAGKL